VFKIKKIIEMEMEMEIEIFEIFEIFSFCSAAGAVAEIWTVCFVNIEFRERKKLIC
jgi:hypothetical protein